MLAIIAGTGHLPVELVASCRAAAVPVVVAALEGGDLAFDAGVAVKRFRVENLMPFLSDLRDGGVTEICFAGAVHRPKLDPAALDPETARIVPRLMAAMQAGDNETLGAVVTLFEDEGFTIRGAHEVLPALCPQAGVLGRVRPTAQDEKDAARAGAVLAALSSADLGQGCVVAQGQVLAVEALPGTTWMLKSLATLGFAARPTPAKGRGVLAKAPKAAQDRRIDLPTIGPDTIAEVAGAGLGGVVIEAGGVILLDRAKTVALANDAGLLLWVRERD